MARILVLDGDTRQSLPVMRALRDLGHHVTVACESRLSMGWMSRFPHRRLLLPPAETQPDRFVEALTHELRTGRFDVALPLFDICAHLVCRHKSDLERYTRIPLVDLEVFMRARDKAATMRICQERGIPCPRTHFPDQEPLDEIARRVDYPVLVKPRIGHGAMGIERAHSAGELPAVHRRVEEKHGPAVVQELIPQTDLQYKAELFRDRAGGIRAGVVFSKLRYFPITGGTSSVNQTVERPDILETSRRLLEALDWVGYADLDFIQDPRDGTAKLMEINPRVTGSVKIAFEAGVDFADLLVKHALGEELPSFPDYRLGVTMRYLPLDILWMIYSPDRLRARPSWFRFWGRDLCYQVLSASDPGPFVALTLGGLRRLLSPSVRAAKLGRPTG